MVAGERAWLQGGHVWLPGGVRGYRGCAWLPGGVHGWWGACVVARGACVVARGEHVWLWGACVGYDEIQSMSGRYASYWNAFLFCNFFTENCMKMKEFARGGGVPGAPLDPSMY